MLLLLLLGAEAAVVVSVISPFAIIRVASRGGMMVKLLQDPDEQLVYEMDWTSWLPSGQTIASSTWPTVSGLTFDNSAILDDSLKTAIRISGGEIGKTYQIANRIVTDGSPTQTGDNSFLLSITEL